MEESSQPKPLMTDLRYVKGIAVSSRFSEDGYNAFYNLDFKPDDIVALTFAKCGTTFLQKILYLLTRLDETGDFPPTMHRDKGHGPYPDNTIDDIVNQPSPRIFSTHLRPEMVPPHVADKARVVYMLRNPKDTHVSFHHMVAKMRGVQGGWLGTPEHQGTYSYYMEKSYFEHLKAMQTFIDEQANGRVLVLYYEDVVTNVRDNVRKLAAYLNVPLSDAKFDAIVTKSSFSNMQAAAPERRQMLFCKGGNGDWKNYIDTDVKDAMPTPSTEQWQRFDDELAKLKDLPLAQPLFQWMN
ncbi:sulfotransferase, cytosolic, 6B, member 1 [Aphanomyces cochlioides]|nr:sulfotransferase, cytosolic, 6B, member 1 [Aphanomyces cochlioides]